MNQLDWLCDSCDVDGWHLGNVVITYTALNVIIFIISSIPSFNDLYFNNYIIRH